MTARYIHIWRPLQYSPHTKLPDVGDVLTAGENYNPFYGFFVHHRRVYAEMTPDGRVEHPPVHFLRMIAEGQRPITPDIPKFAFDIAKHYALLVRELVWESIRQSEFPALPSRQKCMWLTRPEQVENWKALLGNDGGGSVLTLDCEGSFHHCDAGWLVDESVQIPTLEACAREYWRGTPAPNGQQPETLFSGRATVVESK